MGSHLSIWRALKGLASTKAVCWADWSFGSAGKMCMPSNWAAWSLGQQLGGLGGR